jgi:uncharacterized damage-inducible protein DinB
MRCFGQHSPIKLGRHSNVDRALPSNQAVERTGRSAANHVRARRAPDRSAPGLWVASDTGLLPSVSEVKDMTDAAETFLNESRRYLRDEYPASIDRAVLALTDGQIWWRPNEGSNSIGNLILHLAGNVRQWIVAGVGRQPNERSRQQEFDERRTIPKHELFARLTTVLAEADAVLANLRESELGEARQIHGFDTTVMKAIYHVVEHFSMHTGQIQWIAKSQPGRL